VTKTEAIDPSAMSLSDLRRLRHELQSEDDAVSYARRVAQARLDLVSAETTRRAEPDDGESGDASEDLRSLLSQHLTAGPARPPRPTEDLSDHPLAVELDELCVAGGFGRLRELDDDELASLAASISDFEQRVSSDRRERFDRLDDLSAELVRRYRDGSADVDTLLADG
jgi:hypothetical protein